MGAGSDQHCALVQLPMLGCFAFTSAKEHRSVYKAHMFVMRVLEELDMWPEQDQRQRSWVRPTFMCCAPNLPQAAHVLLVPLAIRPVLLAPHMRNQPSRSSLPCCAS
jgi:hypothetical protein